jgi:hypothetical protein
MEKTKLVSYVWKVKSTSEFTMKQAKLYLNTQDQLYAVKCDIPHQGNQIIITDLKQFYYITGGKGYTLLEKVSNIKFPSKLTHKNYGNIEF